MPTILHFADAHIDIANHGRHDAQTGLAVRVIDFLKSLDFIVDTAIQERVDLVIFAGDAYKDRNPAPTFQREWGRRIMRLSHAGIPAILLVGNHDLSPALGRAHALDPFDTLEVPHVRVIHRPAFLRPQDLEGVPLQIIALPWISRSGYLAQLDSPGREIGQMQGELVDLLTELVNTWLDEADPSLPCLLTAHASVEGASYGTERMVMLGSDLVLPGSFVRDPRLDYVALGHIHKPQNLNPDRHPPVVYPGSIERVDWGEAEDQKYFVIAHVERGHTEVEWRPLSGIRPFILRKVRLESEVNVDETLRKALPDPDALEGAMVRFIIEYPHALEALINESALQAHMAKAFEFHLIRQRQTDIRIRLPENKAIGTLTPQELLEIYWQANQTDPAESKELLKLASEVIRQVAEGE